MGQNSFTTIAAIVAFGRLACPVSFAHCCCCFGSVNYNLVVIPGKGSNINLPSDDVERIAVDSDSDSNVTIDCGSQSSCTEKTVAATPAAAVASETCPHLVCRHRTFTHNTGNAAESVTFPIHSWDCDSFLNFDPLFFACVIHKAFLLAVYEGKCPGINVINSIGCGLNGSSSLGFVFLALTVYLVNISQPDNHFDSCVFASAGTVQFARSCKIRGCPWHRQTWQDFAKSMGAPGAHRLCTILQNLWRLLAPTDFA